jgi:hypothetical protein
LWVLIPRRVHLPVGDVSESKSVGAVAARLSLTDAGGHAHCRTASSWRHFGWGRKGRLLPGCGTRSCRPNSQLAHHGAAAQRGGDHKPSEAQGPGHGARGTRQRPQGTNAPRLCGPSSASSFRAERGKGGKAATTRPPERSKPNLKPADPSQRDARRTTTRTPTAHVNRSPQPGNHSTYAFPIR